MISIHGVSITVSAALSLALSVAACAPGPGTRVPPPAPGVGGAAPIAPAQPQAAPAQGAGEGTAGTQRIKPDTTSQAYRADMDSCYSFARARVAHDRRIERDSTAAFDAFPTGLGLNQLRGSMNEFELKNDRASLFSDCMAAKGYDKQ